MSKLTDKQIAEYLQRSYTATDGLWFMKVEDQFNFETALEIDRQVWQIVPKIQARKLKSLLKLERGIDALLQCFSAKLEIDGFEFNTELLEQNQGFRININKCPWHEILVASGREKLSRKIGDCICPAEYSIWAREFGENIEFAMDDRICHGKDRCFLAFSVTSSPLPAAE
ncbi:MAG: L-2-amino-thiazoline-4-carboxylic acid hydrolase [Sedimentisphaerales bacterium]|nr:L-2-amino-thiazoline-4-carboxylic acid hydrolase [Sedimentisphaerales bacterium]